MVVNSAPRAVSSSMGDVGGAVQFQEHFLARNGFVVFATHQLGSNYVDERQEVRVWGRQRV